MQGCLRRRELRLPRVARHDAFLALSGGGLDLTHTFRDRCACKGVLRCPAKRTGLAGVKQMSMLLDARQLLEQAEL